VRELEVREQEREVQEQELGERVVQVCYSRFWTSRHQSNRS
jgi:hypothetical protein